MAIFFSTIALILAPGPIDIEAQRITDIQSIPKNTQFVIYENPTYGFRINFPKLWEFEVAENGSANPIQVVYFYSSPDDENLSGDFTVEVERLNGSHICKSTLPIR